MRTAPIVRWVAFNGYIPSALHSSALAGSNSFCKSAFCIKAWQLITHTAASPTYRRLRSPIAVNERDSVGSFRQTEQVWQAWQVRENGRWMVARNV